jgi:alanine racemase
MHEHWTATLPVIGEVRISLAALQANAQTLGELVGPEHAAFVVKGNAYGHGLIETARAIEPIASYICVYALEEALALRADGITGKILVLGPVEASALDEAMEAQVELALWDTGAYVRDLIAAARKRSGPAAVHVKINTGLNRLGLEPRELADAVEGYFRLSDLRIAGVFSHLAAAEEIDSPYTMHQLSRFNDAYERAQPVLRANGAQPIRHIAASAAAMLWPQTRLDLSRFGIALYGLWPSVQTREAANGDRIYLEPALSYVTKIVLTRHVDAGEAIGYGTTFHAPRAMHIGVIPLGYADGIPRLLSNRGAVLVDGVRCAIIGRVAMNMCFIDLGPARDAHAGSTVTLLGRDGEAEITADDWALWSETINYEIVTRLPSTLHRTYV